MSATLKNSRLALIAQIVEAMRLDDLFFDAIGEDSDTCDSGKAEDYSDEITAPCDFDFVGAL